MKDEADSALQDRVFELSEKLQAGLAVRRSVLLLRPALPHHPCSHAQSRQVHVTQPHLQGRAGSGGRAQRQVQRQVRNQQGRLRSPAVHHHGVPLALRLGGDKARPYVAQLRDCGDEQAFADAVRSLAKRLSLIVDADAGRELLTFLER